MEPIRETIDFDPYFKRMRIKIEPEVSYFWIERFISNCSTPELTERALDTLLEAIEAKARWCYNYNDTIAEYDPAQNHVLARFELPEVNVPPVSVMPVAEFLRILCVWRQHLLQANAATRDQSC